MSDLLKRVCDGANCTAIQSEDSHGWPRVYELDNDGGVLLSSNPPLFRSNGNLSIGYKVKDFCGSVCLNTYLANRNHVAGSLSSEPTMAKDASPIQLREG